MIRLGPPVATDNLPTVALRSPDAHAQRLADAQRIAQLELALSHRTVIGQATGLVMERYGLGADAAFTLLSKLSQETNRKVYDISLRLVADQQAEVA